MDSSLKELEQKLVQSWHIDSPDEITHEQLLKALQERIGRLLDTNLEKLMSIMYLLDVDEKLFNRCLSLGNQDKISYALAELVLERELQKLKSRERHRGKSGQPPAVSDQ